MTDRNHIVSSLKKQVASVSAPVEAGVLPLQMAEIDALLPGGGLRLGALHEVWGAAAGGFATALLARLTGPVLWCAGGHGTRPLYPPGLARAGLAPDRLVLARAGQKRDQLWVAEEAMKSGALKAVVLEADFTVPLAASRRLQLSLEAGACLGLLLYGGDETKIAGTTAAKTRWRASPAPRRDGHRAPAWRLELVRNQGGATGDWEVSWHDTAHRFDLVPQARGRPADALGAA